LKESAAGSGGPLDYWTASMLYFMKYGLVKVV
jgi:hypothetical protein